MPDYVNVRARKDGRYRERKIRRIYDKLIGQSGMYKRRIPLRRIKILIEELKFIQMLMIIINPTEISKENMDSSYL